MNDNQRLFCTEYLKDRNATRAYKEVYKGCNSDKVASAAASRLLDKPHIRAYIDKTLREMESANIASVNEIMMYLTSVMRGETSSSVVVVEGEGEGCSSARLMDKPPDEKEKLKAAEMLGKKYGLFTDKHKVEANGTVIITGADELEQ